VIKYTKYKRSIDMPKKKVKPEREIIIRHIVVDGSIHDSIDGYKVPVNENTKPIYELLAKMLQKTSDSR
jgi:hypothetical protein